MSWDVMFFKFAGSPPIGSQKIDPSKMLDLGTAEEVRAAIISILPETDWKDPTWGTFDGEGFSIEFSVGKNETIDNMMLHVRGGGDAIKAIMALAQPFGWSAFDCSTAEFLSPLSPSDEGWKRFQEFRDRILKKQQRRKP